MPRSKTIAQRPLSFAHSKLQKTPNSFKVMAQELLPDQMVVIPIRIFGGILLKTLCWTVGVCITVNVLVTPPGKSMKLEAICRIGVDGAMLTNGMITLALKESP